MIIKDGTYSVYIHTNKINGKRYVGITSVDPVKRWDNGRGYLTQMFFRAIEKYGWDNFEHEIFASNLTKEEACNMEIILIKQLQTTNPEYGYNIHEGGGLPPVLKGDKNPFYHHYSEAAVAASVAARTGKKLTEQHKRKISDSMKGYIKSEEHRRNMSISQKGKPRGTGALCKNSKPVMCVQTKEVYDSQKIAAEKNNVSTGMMSKAIKTKCECNGKHFVSV